MSNEKKDVNELDRIEKRAIEAEAIVSVIRAVAEKFGEKEAMAILQNVNEEEAFQRGQMLKTQLGKNGIAELSQEVAKWGEGCDMEIEVLEHTQKRYFFNIHRCPYYEKYKELGVTEYGVALSCCRDEAFARGFNKQLQLKRSQTIMEGADYCDFRYSLIVD